MLDDLVAQSIIAPVAEPTEWAHPLVVVGKPNGKLRLCVDLTKLNQHVKRPTHPLRSTKDLVAGIPPTSQIFSTFDAIHLVVLADTVGGRMPAVHHLYDPLGPL